MSNGWDTIMSTAFCLQEKISPKALADGGGLFMLVRKNPSFPLRSYQYSTYGRVLAMREGIRGENWIVVGQTNAREGRRGKLDSSRTDDCAGGGWEKLSSALREPNYSIRATFGRKK